jgi:hypothetical protein
MNILAPASFPIFDVDWHRLGEVALAQLAREVFFDVLQLDAPLPQRSLRALDRFRGTAAKAAAELDCVEGRLNPANLHHGATVDIKAGKRDAFENIMHETLAQAVMRRK